MNSPPDSVTEALDLNDQTFERVASDMIRWMFERIVAPRHRLSLTELLALTGSDRRRIFDDVTLMVIELDAGGGSASMSTSTTMTTTTTTTSTAIKHTSKRRRISLSIMTQVNSTGVATNTGGGEGIKGDIVVLIGGDEDTADAVDDNNDNDTEMVCVCM